LGAENLGRRIRIGKQEQQEEQENKKYRFYLSTKLCVSLQSLTRATYKQTSLATTYYQCIILGSVFLLLLISWLLLVDGYPSLEHS
jgi:hypothetical protein